MSSSNCCFLTCIQVPQEAGQVVLYSHVFQNFPQFIVIHIVKGFGIVNKAEIDVFLFVNTSNSQKNKLMKFARMQEHPNLNTNAINALNYILNK